MVSECPPSKTHVKVPDPIYSWIRLRNILNILDRCTISIKENLNVVYLPLGQLDRKTYLVVSFYSNRVVFSQKNIAEVRRTNSRRGGFRVADFPID